MQLEYQPDLFENDVVSLLREVQSVKITQDKMRKGWFARFNELAKICVVLQDQITELKIQKKEF